MIGKDISVTCGLCGQTVTATEGGFVYAHKVEDARWPAHLWPACEGSNKWRSAPKPGLLTDQELLNALSPTATGRAYNVFVTGRFGENATYRVTARNAEIARRIGREYAKRIDRAHFRISGNPVVSDVSRAEW